MIAPKPVSGFSREAVWSNRVINYLRSKVLLPGRGYRIRQYPDGVALEIEQRGGSGRGLEIATYRFKEHAGDYIVCRTWDGTTEGDADINIAKPSLLRFAVGGRRIRGITVDYGAYDAANQSRVATPVGGLPETQFITPSYGQTNNNAEVPGPDDFEGDLIYAVKAKTFVTDADDAEVSLLDLNVDGRAWAAQ